MSIRTLRTFLAVAKHGSFAAAGKEIGLTQAAVSLQMKTLEDELKARLFDRSRRSIVLNTTARNLIPRAAEIVSLYENLALSASSESVGGTLNVGAIPPTFSRLLPDALLRLRQDYPRIEVRVINGRSDELAIKVERGELDAALVSYPPSALPRTLVWHSVVKEPLVFVAPLLVNVTTLREVLAREPFIRITRHSWTGQLIDQALRRRGIVVRDIMELDPIDVIAEMVSRGLGVSVIPMYDGTWQENPKLQIWLINKPKIERAVGLIERQNHSRAQITAAFLGCLVRHRVRQVQATNMQSISII